MNLGGIIGGIGRKIGGGIKQGINKIGELQPDDMGDASPLPMPRRPITGGFAGNEGVPKFDIGSMGRADQDGAGIRTMEYRFGEDGPGRRETMEIRKPNHPNFRPDIDGGGQIQLLGGAQQPMPTRPQMPPLTGINQPAANQPSYIEPQMRSGGVEVEDVQAQQQLPTRPVPEVMIPQLPGRRGPKREYDPVIAAEYEYVTDTMDDKGKIPRSWKTIGQNALLGAANAYKANPNGGLGAMLGGALGGGAGAAISPVGGRENVFNEGYRPGLERDEARAQQRQEIQRKNRMGGLAEREANADIGLKEAQRRRAERIPGNIGEATWGTYDTTTGQPIWQRPPGASAQPAPSVHVDGEGFYRNMRTGELILDPATKQPIKAGDKPITFADAEARRSEEEGSPEKIAMDSYEARGGDNYVISKMPPQLQQILKNPNADVISQLPSVYQQILKNPPQAGDTGGIELLTKAEQARAQLEQRQQQLYMQAQNEFQQAKQQQIATDRRWTAEQAKVNAGKYRTGGATRPSAQGSGSGSGGKIKLSQALDILKKASGER